MIEGVKKQRGKQNSVTLSLYTQGQLESLVDKLHIPKSAIITIALEKYAREIEREEIERGLDKK